MKKVLLTAIVSLLSFQTVMAEDWGTLSGQVIVKGDIPAPELLHGKDAEVKDKEVCAAVDVYKDDLVINAENKGLANVFVYLAKAPKSVHPDLKKVDPKAKMLFDQKGCMFTPHALIARTGQVVEVISDDSVAHNTHTYPLKNQAINVLITPNAREGKGYAVDNYTSSESLPFAVKCDFHPWMQAYWLVLDHPYAAVTDKDGKFSIPNLPAGDHEFRVWHEKVGYINRKYTVKIKAGDNAEKPIEVDGAGLKAGKLK